MMPCSQTRGNVKIIHTAFSAACDAARFVIASHATNLQFSSAVASLNFAMAESSLIFYVT